MMFTDEFLKWTVADTMDLCDRLFREADEGCDASRPATENPKDYYFHLGRRSLAQEIRDMLTDRLARESIKREQP